jgi:hypothetical protein
MAEPKVSLDGPAPASPAPRKAPVRKKPAAPAVVIDRPKGQTRTYNGHTYHIETN